MGSLQEEKPKKERSPWPAMLAIKAGDCEHCGQPTARHEVSCLAQVKDLAATAIAVREEAKADRDDAIAERDAARQERDAAVSEITQLQKKLTAAQQERDEYRQQLDAIRENAEAAAAAPTSEPEAEPPA